MSEPALPVKEAVKIVHDFHVELATHFADLRDSRHRLAPTSPVYALEHGLTDDRLRHLKLVVRIVIVEKIRRLVRDSWLPFVVYATEVGYNYDGTKYWPLLEAETPGWQVPDDPERLRGFFEKFTTAYGGARPEGAFAERCNIIAWPIMHAVLPRYLQRQLARLLYEFRTGLTTDLLNDPDTLGTKLAARSQGYSERFRIFCGNTALLGQVAAALLLGEDEESSYLLPSTLARIVEGLSQERQTKAWLSDARSTAHQVRVRGMQVGAGSGSRPSLAPNHPARLPMPVDPRLFLRRAEDIWHAYVAIPDLTSLGERLPHVVEEVERRRAVVAGTRGRPLVHGRLTYPGQEVELAEWPGPETPFVQLENGDEAVNALLADQCQMSRGPWWVFRYRPGAPAVEVKGKLLRPGQCYVLVARDGTAPPTVSWISEAPLKAASAVAYEVNVPALVTDEDRTELTAAGIGLLHELSVRPVGLVPSAWDGQGAAEWQVGEPVTIAIHTDGSPGHCLVCLDGEPSTLPWPPNQSDLLVRFNDLEVGSHRLDVTVIDGRTTRPLVDGTFVIGVRDPQARPQTATSGEGLRMRATPARPTLPDIWELRAGISLEGPEGAKADLAIRLRDDAGKTLRRVDRRVPVPMDVAAWNKIVKGNLHKDLENTYDAAESCEVSVSASGIGFASQTFERPFRALRWVPARQRDGRYRARLIDHSSGAATTVTITPFEAPLSAEVCLVPTAEITAPRWGGLLTATNGSSTASIILPADQEIFQHHVRPDVRRTSTSALEDVVRLIEADRVWAEAELPAQPVARWQQEVVVSAIPRAMGLLIGGSRWSAIEKRLADGEAAIDLLQQMQMLVGDSGLAQAVATAISKHLWRWANAPESRQPDFAAIMSELIRRSGIGDAIAGVDFLLKLANCPRLLAEGEPEERKVLIRKVLVSPALYRAARFAVLGTEAFLP